MKKKMKSRKNNKRIVITTFIILSIIAAALAGILLFFKISIKDGAVHVGNSIQIPYAYAVYKDYVVLEQYQGKEAEVIVPGVIFNRPVTIIEYGCFARNNHIETVVLSENIETIGVWAFEECENLQEVLNGKSVKVVEASAFYGCNKLETVDIGTNVERIEKVAFSGCTALKKMNPQKHLKQIGKMAFMESGLEEFEFPQDVELGNSIFVDSNWIKNQSEEYIIYGDGALIGYNGDDDKIMIPDTVKTLKGGCLTGLVRNEIYIPESVTVIHDFTFTDCEDVRVYIPASVKQLGSEDGGYEPENPIMNSDFTMTIITTRDSAAHQYAKENKIPYKIVEGW